MPIRATLSSRARRRSSAEKPRAKMARRAEPAFGRLAGDYLTACFADPAERASWAATT